MNIALLCLIVFTVICVGLMYMVVYALQKDRDYYKDLAEQNYNLWLDAVKEEE